MADKKKPEETPEPPLDIKAMVEGVANLSDEELAQNQQKLTALFDQLADDPSDENLAKMESEVTPAILALREAVAQRVADKTARETKVAELKAKVTPKAEDPPPEEEEEEEPAPQEPQDKETQSEEEVKAEEKVAASARPSLQVLNERRPEEMAPRAEDHMRVKMSMVAGGDIPGHSAGMPFKDVQEVGEAFISKLDSLSGARLAEGARYPVAKFKLDYPEERRLSQEDPMLNTKRVSDVVGPTALTAAGGLCAPVEGYYNLDTTPSVESRPLRDGLARFNASRGGIRFITPPALSDLTGAIGTVTAADDESGYPPANKPCLTITCGTDTEVVITAVTLCLRIGQFSRMTFPEQFAAWYQLALAQHARVAEGLILNALSTGSTAITTGQVLGAAPDLFDNFERVAVRYRSFHRMDPNSTLMIALPFWVRNVIRADIVREMPGNGMEQYGVSDAWIDAQIRARGLEPIWYLDTRTGAGQVFGAQAAGAAHPWILTVEWYLFTPGSFLFLEGGTLDLGVEIRDTTLIATNDVQAFMETFENVAHVGPEALRVRSAICINGAHGALASVTCTSGS